MRHPQGALSRPRSYGRNLWPTQEGTRPYRVARVTSIGHGSYIDVNNVSLNDSQ